MFEVVRTASKITNKILVGFSGGKDSAATLDLCFRYFPVVQPYFMYIVKGLNFQERTLRYYEKRYHCKIIRIPHFMLSDFLQGGSFRLPDYTVPTVKTIDIYNYLRSRTGIHWIAGGERMADSIVRNAMLKQSGAIDRFRGRVYPLAYWNKKQVLSYVKLRKLPLSLENRILGFSFRGLQGADMYKIKQAFPEDYEKIRRVFPLIEAAVKRYEYYGK